MVNTLGLKDHSGDLGRELEEKVKNKSLALKEKSLSIKNKEL